MSRLLFLTLCWSVGTCAHAQSDTLFLWFTGHWSPAKKNTFIATGLSGDTSGSGGSTGGGTTLTIGHNGAVHVSSPGIDAWNRWVGHAVTAEQQFIQQLENPRDNLDPATHRLYQLILPEAEEYEQELRDLRIDGAQDILSPDTRPGQSSGSGQSTGSGQPTGSGETGNSGRFGQSAGDQSKADFCRRMKADYDEVIGWWKAHRHDKDADLTYAPPPAFEYDCYSCDSSLRKVYEQTIDNYVRDFFHPEDSLVRKGLGILRAQALTTPWPCAYFSDADPARAVNEIASHAFRRATKMLMENRKNFKAEAAIARTWLAAARFYTLLTGAKGLEDNGLAEIGGIIGEAIDHYLGELRHNDWRQIGNIPFLIALMRDAALTTGRETGSDDFLTRLQRIWNGFELSIDMDIKVGKDGGYVIIHEKGKCHIIPAFQQDSNQCYKWVVADEGKVNIIGCYMPSTTQTIDCNLLDAEMITPRGRPRYVGTRGYRTTLKSLSMDFCNPGHDTIMLTNFYPNPTTAGLWEMPDAGRLNLGDYYVDEFFQSVAEQKRLVTDGEARKAADQMKQQAQQLVAQMQALKTQMGGAQGAANYEKMMEMAQKARSLPTAPVAGKLLYIDFTLPVQNNNAVLVDKRFDAKEINPGESAVIVYGYYTIHIENDGNAKQKVTP